MDKLDEKRIRFKDLIDQKILNTRINIIGAGAIGSWACLTLAKMGFTDIFVFDSDKVSIENVGLQLYGSGHIGELKVTALYRIVKDLTDIEIKAIPLNYEAKANLQGMTLVGVDSMRARRDIYELHLTEYAHSGKYIDLRMGSTTMLGYSFENIFDKSYENTLYTDENAVQERCTAKGTIYTATIIGGVASRLTQSLLEGKPIKAISANLSELIFV